MRISDVIRTKGGDVVTIAPDETVGRLLELLHEHGFGALVVSADGSAIDGIVSERDVVRRLHDRGREVLDGPVSAIMTSEVQTAGPDEDVETLATRMTERRFRHVPIVGDDGALVGIVSIGDVVKSRISQLEAHTAQLEDYIKG